MDAADRHRRHYRDQGVQVSARGSHKRENINGLVPNPASTRRARCRGCDIRAGVLANDLCANADSETALQAHIRCYSIGSDIRSRGSPQHHTNVGAGNNSIELVKADAPISPVPMLKFIGPGGGQIIVNNALIPGVTAWQ